VHSSQLHRLVDGLIARRVPIDDREQVSIDKYRSAIDQLLSPCSETSDPTHVTSSAIVVGPEGLLLHRHKRLGIWLQPGGHIDPGEDPADAAVRETFEETGIRATHYAHIPLLVHLDVHPGPKGHTHLDLRYLLWGSGAPDPGVGESPDVKWFSWADAKKLDEPGIATCIAALTSPALRPAIPDDSAAIAEIFLRSFRWAYEDGLVRSAHGDDETRQWVRNTMMATNTVVVAVVAGMPIGYVAIDAEAGRLNHLYVDPAWIGTGVGSQLFDEAKRLVPDGFDLWTFQENLRAQQFYLRRGCVAVEHTDGSDNEENQPDVRLVWSSVGSTV
jgi:8-oxo-dGTP pyrophosphatase MutT (NUDIX family)/GNAT superfamily N-acetyltransferase